MLAGGRGWVVGRDGWRRGEDGGAFWRVRGLEGKRWWERLLAVRGGGWVVQEMVEGVRSSGGENEVCRRYR